MKDKLMPWKKRSALPERWRNEDPFGMLHREINDLFDCYYRGFGGLGRRMAGSEGFELSETDDEIRVKAEMPGMDEKETRKWNYHISEMNYGGYHRSIPLPASIDREKAKAKFKRGVLALTLPKTEAAKADRKRIPISTE